MRLKPIFFSLTGLIFAIGAIYVAEGLLNAQPATASDRGASNSITLLAAGSDIPFGDPISRDQLVPQTWPIDLAPEGAFDGTTALLGADGTPPRRATQTIKAGDLILASTVSDFGATVSIGRSLNPGTRAVAIRVDETTAVGGFVTPGDRIDIVLTQGSGSTLRTGTILQDIRVLAADASADDNRARASRTVTVEVGQRDSQKLVLAQQVGILSLTLRNDDIQLSDEDLSEITLDDIWGETEEIVVAPAPAVSPGPAPTTVRVRRGTQSQDVVHSQ